LKIYFTRHAERQLQERNISKEAVRKTVFNPDQVVEQEEDILLFQSILVEEQRKYLLRVVAKIQADDYLILTAYRTSKIEKYWRED